MQSVRSRRSDPSTAYELCSGKAWATSQVVKLRAGARSFGGEYVFIAQSGFLNHVPMYSSVRPCVSARGGTGYILAAV